MEIPKEVREQAEFLFIRIWDKVQVKDGHTPNEVIEELAASLVKYSEMWADYQHMRKAVEAGEQP